MQFYTMYEFMLQASLFLRDIFVAYRIPGWQFLQHLEDIISLLSLAGMVSYKESTVILIFAPLDVIMYHFFLWLCDS